LGIPEAEQKFLSGVGAQYESEMVYHSILEHLENKASFSYPSKMGYDNTRTFFVNISVR